MTRDAFDLKYYQRVSEGPKPPDVPAGTSRVWRNPQTNEFYLVVMDSKDKSIHGVKLEKLRNG